MKKSIFIILVSSVMISCPSIPTKRYFTPEAYENELKQESNQTVLNRIKQDSTDKRKEVVFSFYFKTNKRKKINDLMDYFEFYEPSSQLMELNQLGRWPEVWELNGRSYPIPLHIDSLNQWEKKLWDIGYRFDCKLTYWAETTLP